MLARLAGFSVALPLGFILISTCAASADYFWDDLGFLKGVNSREEVPVDILKDIGANSMCLLFRWNEIEPEVTGYMTVRRVKRNPELIDDFILSHDWGVIDERIQPFIDAGINVFAVVGSGLDFDLPLFKGEPANPDRLGRRNYLGHIYLLASAVARRYKDRVQGFVLESELNEASLAAVYGWRSPSPLEAQSLWSDFQFLTTLMETLSEAVRSEAPDILTIANFHTDVHDNFHSAPVFRYIAGDKNWIEAALAWQSYIDVVAIDAYPNYYNADPVYSGDIKDRVARARSELPDKPVIVLETGYSVPQEGENPDPVDWTEEKQNEYVDGAIRGALEAGAEGFFYFDLTGKGCRPPPGGYTEKDLLALEKLGPPFREGDVKTILSLVKEFGLDYLQGRFVDVLKAAEGFGFIRLDGSKRQAYYTIKTWYEDIITEPEANTSPKIDIAPHIRGLQYQNYPNPFNPDTWIPYRLTEDTWVTIRIYHAAGKLIRTLDLGRKPAGFYTTEDRAAYWDGKNEPGESVASGIYFYTIQAGDLAATKKMVVRK